MIPIDELRAKRSLLEDLRSMPFDFDMIAFKVDRSWLTFEPPSAFTFLAGDYSGGSYVAYGAEPTDQQPVFHVSSGGFATRLGADLAETLEHVISIPNWSDVACRDFAAMEERMKDKNNMDELDEMFPNWRVVQTRLGSELGINISANHAARLHRSIGIGESIAVIVNGNPSPSPF
jgi:hypothetical protein